MVSLKNIVCISSVSLLLLAGASALAQSAAPRETVSAQVGSAEVKIEYGRPALKGRNVSDLMQQLPADRMWRAGSEQVTTLTTTAPIELGGTVVPAGKYSLYLHCPEDGPYAVALNKVLGQPLKKIWDAAPPQLANEPWPHFNYQAEIGDQEVVRAPMTQSGSEQSVDLFTISLSPKGNAAEMKMAWGDQVWSLDMKSAGSAGSMPEGSYH